MPSGILTLFLVSDVSFTIFHQEQPRANSSIPAYALFFPRFLVRDAAPEPLANLYSPDFYRSTWITTALDAGFATAMPIQPKFIRDILSVVFFLYYLVYGREADEKVCIFCLPSHYTLGLCEWM